MARPRKQNRDSECQVCEQRRKLNRHGVCSECAQAMDLKSSDVDATAVFTASHSLADILPFADKDMDEPRDWYGRNK